MKFFYKIKVGYGENEFIPIDETELETVLYAFLTNGKAVFTNGVVRGKDIIAITEDWQKEMGWNTGYKMQDIDWAEIRDTGIEQKYKEVFAEKKKKVQFLINSKQTNLIGKNVEVKQLN